MKVHKEGTGLLLTLFTIFFVVDVALYHTVGRGWVFYTTTFVTTVLFLLVLNFFRSPFRRFPFDSEGLVMGPPGLARASSRSARASTPTATARTTSTSTNCFPSVSGASANTPWAKPRARPMS